MKFPFCFSLARHFLELVALILLVALIFLTPYGVVSYLKSEKISSHWSDNSLKKYIVVTRLNEFR